MHCSKNLRDQTFKAIYLEIYWEKSLQIVVRFSRNIVLDNAVVAEKNSKIYFYITDGNHPNHKCIRVIANMTFILSNTLKHYTTLFIVKSVAGMATDLTINYSKFTPLNVWNFAPLHVFFMLR